MSDSFYDFDPNGSSTTVWGVWNGSSFYIKPKRGGCLTKFMRSPRAKLYELTSLGWTLHAVKDTLGRNDTCDLCGLAGVEDAHKHASGNAHTKYPWWGFDPWRWKREKGKISSPPVAYFACPGCITREGL